LDSEDNKPIYKQSQAQKKAGKIPTLLVEAINNVIKAKKPLPKPRPPPKPRKASISEKDIIYDNGNNYADFKRAYEAQKILEEDQMEPDVPNQWGAYAGSSDINPKSRRSKPSKYNFTNMMNQTYDSGIKKRAPGFAANKARKNTILKQRARAVVKNRDRMAKAYEVPWEYQVD